MRKLTPTHRLRAKLRNRNSAYHPRNVNYKWFLLANIMLGTFMAVLDRKFIWKSLKLYYFYHYR
ncbi:MAG: hypothetical protein PHP53_20785 [Prolixibacteraceae bacterium]|nr:hypothetical protein [Prolixibacteraceae bacterium]